MKFAIASLIVAAPLALMGQSPASATTIPLGTLLSGTITGLTLETLKASTSPFSEIYTFFVPYTEQVVISSEEITTVEKAGDLNPTLTGSFDLYSGSPTGALVEHESILPGIFKNTYDAQLSDTVVAGNYYIELSGLFDPGKFVTSKKGVTTYVVDSNASFGESGTVAVTAVPEVSTWVMMLLGFAGLGLAGYRRAGQSVVGQF